MARNFNPNEAGIKEILLSPSLRRVLAEIAGKGKRFAETIAPYDATPDDEGHYRDSFEVREETIEWQGRHRGPRAAVQLIATAPYSAAVEYGYEGRSQDVKVNAHRVLGRTLDYLESEK